MTNKEYQKLKNTLIDAWDTCIQTKEEEGNTIPIKEEVLLLKEEKFEAQNQLFEYYQNTIEERHDDWKRVLEERVEYFEQKAEGIKEELNELELEEQAEEEFGDALELRLPTKVYRDSPSRILEALEYPQYYDAEQEVVL